MSLRSNRSLVSFTIVQAQSSVAWTKDILSPPNNPGNQNFRPEVLVARIIGLLATLAALTFQATVLARLRAGDEENMRRMAVKVA